MTTNINKGMEHLPQTEPPDSVWENIERNLDDEKRRRKPLWLVYTLSTAASVAIIACAWFLMQRIQETPNVAQIKTTDTQKITGTDETGNAKVADRIMNAADNTAGDSAIKDTHSQLLLVCDSVTLTTTFTGTFAPSAVYEWNFGDVNFSATSPSLNYASPGTFTLGITQQLNITSNYTPYIGADELNSTRSYSTLDQLPNIEITSEKKGKWWHRKDREKETLEQEKPEADKKEPEAILWDLEDEKEEDPISSETYAPLIENEYVSPFKKPLSTFSIDVDNASYANTRRMVQAGQKPPHNAVRVEEFVNYFKYDYAPPKGEDPFAIHLETASCPWNKNTRIVSVGLQGKEADRAKLPASNLVFLIDVSGSMEEENKLPLVKKSLALLVDQMGPKDRIAIVTYAGAAGLVLPSTACSEKEAVKAAIDNLDAGGSTAGGEGIQLAYKVAVENFVRSGNNRIILVTDGDFNVGQSSDEDMKTLIEQKRKEGVFLTVCGFGMGNYKDSKMELLADKGNGNYYYIDTYKESKKVFVTDLTGTLFTIAKDVKIQVEFNPKFVKAYRLIGYENRFMPAQDFNDDTKDAGELGAGHTVTALYEIIPVGSPEKFDDYTELKYQQPENKSLKDYGHELLTVKLRYKQPDGETSKLLQRTLANNTQGYETASQNLRFACGVTAYAMLLRDSKFKGTATYALAKQLVESTKLNVENGYREELLQLITLTEKIPQ